MATQEPPAKREDTCDSGYKCLFKDDNIEDRFKCSSCKRVSRNPHLTCCSVQFCAQHLKKLAENDESCPECGEKYESVPQRKINQQILKFAVYCTMRKQGCRWEGAVKDLDKHESICKYTYVPCPHDCGQEQIERGSLDKHTKQDCPKREYACPHCNFKDTYRFVTTAHMALCSYKPITCPNKCGVRGERDDMETHQDECPLEYIPCKLGCSTKFRREDETQHIKDNSQQHLVWLVNTTLEMSETIRDLTAKSEHQQEQNEQMKKQFEDSIAQKHQENEKEIEELKTQLEQERSRLDLLEKQVGNMTNNSQRDDISPPEHSGDSEQREIRELQRKSDEKDRELKQLSDKLKRHETESSEQITQLNSKIIQLEKIFNNPSRNPLVAPVEPPHPQNDHLAFVLENYSREKEEGGEWSSPAFPAFDNGPLLRVIVWPNGQGEGKETHVSVWLAQEADCFSEPRQVTLKLELIGQGLNPAPNHSTKDFVVPSLKSNRYLGYFSNKFIAHADLTNASLPTQYLVDDSLEFQITCTCVCMPENFQDEPIW